MTEYHDRHTISRLIGSGMYTSSSCAVIDISALLREPAPGYVGFEEGGQLTEAVRRRPYGRILYSYSITVTFTCSHLST
jgi:ATP-dependent Clp protease ATP-binding subunit ClpB